MRCMRHIFVKGHVPIMWNVFIAVFLVTLYYIEFIYGLTLPLVSCDADGHGITWPKSHVTLHFSCLDVRNAIVLLIMPLVLHDTNARTCDTGTLEPMMLYDQRSCYTSFWSSDLRNGLVAIDDTYGITWCRYQCQCARAQSISQLVDAR